MQEEKLPLWSNEKFEIFTPINPHIPPEEGLHVVVYPKTNVPSAWANPDLCAETFKVAARVAQIMEELKLAPWFNLQANGNWGLLPDNTPRFHVHIYARRKGKTWGAPVQLPLAPGTYHNEPMSEEEMKNLTKFLEARLYFPKIKV
ncbi:hypothetical protein AMJ48_00985 [Parcubacteria bacterium DG_74_1]|nr:MAG: hypothetical protein AMJ48_00985 [Parcubacteria bacterium DG_74_1]